MIHPLIAEARKYLGAPYVYGARGDRLFDLERLVLEPSHWLPLEVFDCSGVVLVAIYRLGGPDWCGTHNAASLQLDCNRVTLGTCQPGDLLFRPGHVAIFVSPGKDPAHVVVIEAAGGRSSTRSPAAAAKTGAHVAEHEVPLSHFTAAGRLPPDLLPFPPAVNGV